MNRLTKLFNDRFVLLVSITQNDLNLAKIAQEAGADAIKVHLNCAHFASGTNFGSWKEEKAKIQEILKNITIPVGIVTGAEEVPCEEDMQEIQSSGFAFWDLFAHHTPPRYFDWDVGHMVAVDPFWTPEQVKNLQTMGTNVIESSIIPRTNYRSRLTADDLCKYTALAKSVDIPVIVPTQKAIQPQEIQYLHRAKVRGIAIGAVVTGLGTDHLGRTISDYRNAIDDMTQLYCRSW